MTILRLLISGLIAFCFYAAWAYYANSRVTSDEAILIKAALVQGSYSGGITLFFTFVLEFFHTRFGHSGVCVAFILPRWSTDEPESPCQTKASVVEALDSVKSYCAGRCIPGMLLVPIPALLLQTLLVVAVNLFFETPNLWLTVAPSILFSAIYGYTYSIGLSKHQLRSNVTNS